MTTVAVVGASGFVGSALAELLLADGRYRVRPCIHSSGNAWRLARLGVDLFPVNVLRKRDLLSAIDGCDVVVNCSRGPSEVMLRGLKNLLDVSRKARVRRFVHISSTAVFGEQFRGTLVDEGHPERAVRGSYGWTKARQDRLVRKVAHRGLPSVVLCPPNITGPYSRYLIELVNSLRRGQFAFVEAGALACGVVNVHNLVHAIECAFTASAAAGERIIIADDEPDTWRQLMEPVAELAAIRQIPSIGLEAAQALVAPPRRPRRSVARALRHLVSSDVRAVLSKDPLWESLDRAARRVARRLPSRIQGWLQNGQTNGAASAGAGRSPSSSRLLEQQLRNVRFSSARAATLLNYSPVASFAESSSAFGAWYREQFGLTSEFADLLAVLG